ncbi:MAG TPA: hypothetical protein VKV16_03365, partial [Solirubrobacteraceae bacterium]|nr:hypothetical protein [Solirubrobacteraceae bacterium]
TGRPTLGVLPYVEDLWLDVEDSLALDAPRPETQPAGGGDTLDVAVVRLRWMSNFTDLDALAAEPGVRVRFTRSAADVQRADLVVLPGTKATVEDLRRVRADRLDRALAARAAAGGPILGICGGYQMLGTRIHDEIESRQGAVEGLGLLPVATTFAADKLLRRRSGRCPWLDAPAGGYEIRHGRVARDDGPGHGGGAADGGHGPGDGHGDGDGDGDGGDDGLFLAEDGERDGARAGSVLGTSWHGALEHDELRRALLAWVAARRGRRFVPGGAPFATMREARLDTLGDLVERHLDTSALAALIEGGVPAELPSIATEVRACVG